MLLCGASCPDIHAGYHRALFLDGESGKLRYCDDGQKSSVVRDFEVVAGDVYTVMSKRLDDSVQ